MKNKGSWLGYSDSSKRPIDNLTPNNSNRVRTPQIFHQIHAFQRDTTAYICHFHSYRNNQSTNIPINRNHGKGSRIPRSCRKGQVSNTKGTILLMYFSKKSGNDFGKMGLGNLKRIHRFVESSHTNKNIPNRLSHKRRRSAPRDVPPRERSSLVVSLTLL
ncbi:hypothetical protein EYC84_001189 [Monilinia fructicola]|uniref:Uncharacterized protein n=1 Tax=Monilinia fructicola TaxID=38448 RepID=A0A5M9JP72_MONFR|nr:hypothetical protein EYC84_001189 [Monilinia fructicola]